VASPSGFPTKILYVVAHPPMRACNFVNGPIVKHNSDSLYKISYVQLFLLYIGYSTHGYDIHYAIHVIKDSLASVSYIRLKSDILLILSTGIRQGNALSVALFNVALNMALEEIV
jgi:hypothetical protein